MLQYYKNLTCDKNYYIINMHVALNINKIRDVTTTKMFITLNL